MAVTRILHPWRDRRARLLYQRYGARPWHLLDERTQDHYRKLVADGMDGAGRPLNPTPFPSRRRTARPAADY
jgi:hypothetical protein